MEMSNGNDCMEDCRRRRRKENIVATTNEIAGVLAFIFGVLMSVFLVFGMGLAWLCAGIALFADLVTWAIIYIWKS